MPGWVAIFIFLAEKTENRDQILLHRIIKVKSKGIQLFKKFYVVTFTSVLYFFIWL